MDARRGEGYSGTARSNDGGTPLAQWSCEKCTLLNASTARKRASARRARRHTLTSLTLTSQRLRAGTRAANKPIASATRTAPAVTSTAGGVAAAPSAGGRGT
eukprot:scaffold89767_cov39-Phaeocystis_antarctica.AAC.1